MKISDKDMDMIKRYCEIKGILFIRSNNQITVGRLNVKTFMLGQKIINLEHCAFDFYTNMEQYFIDKGQRQDKQFGITNKL